MSAKITINSKPKQVVKRLLTVLPERARDVLVGRFGLGKDPVKLTLESIGKKYGITRERVRQIVEDGLHQLRELASGKKEQEKLAELFQLLDKRGCKVMLSNSDTDFIKNLYKGYKINFVKATRMINCDATKRGKINEVVITNY